MEAITLVGVGSGNPLIDKVESHGDELGPEAMIQQAVPVCWVWVESTGNSSWLTSQNSHPSVTWESQFLTRLKEQCLVLSCERSSSRLNLKKSIL